MPNNTPPGGNAPNLADLFANATRSGVIGAQAQSLLSGNLGSVVVAGAAGKDAADIVASDVTLVTVLLDASSSIGDRGLEDAVREGYNQLLDTFAGSSCADDVLLALWIFDSKTTVLHSYVPVGDAARLDSGNYRAGGTTKLYDTWCNALAANVAYAEQLRASGTPCRSIVVVITDGEDYGSRKRLKHCATLSRDLVASEEFVLAFVGVGSDVDFRRVALDMGVPERGIAVHGQASPASLRALFQLVSQSAIRVSRSQIAPGPMGGFFT